jgi:8-oxo-dGTP diphosphatase
VEASETPRKALCRELAEELGIRVLPEDLEPLFFAESDTEGANRAIVILLYRSARWHGTPAAIEGEGVGWFEPDAMISLPKPPLDCRLLDQLLAN